MPEDFKSSSIPESASLREAMQVIDSGDLPGMVLITTPENQLLGVMTDGDIRRMLLAGHTMDSPVSPGLNRNFTWVTESTSRDQVLDLIRARSIDHVPILDSERRLVGIHRLGEMISERKLPNVAVIMAGGKGTRLGALTKDIPKPMLKIAGRPILERIVLHLVGSGISRIYIAVNYLREQIESHFGDGHHFGCEILYLRENEPLGSGGALSLLPESPEHPVLVMNGDIVTDFPIDRLFRHHARGGYMATMALSPYHHKVPFGCVTLENGTIAGFREKPLLTELANAGIYVFSPEVLPRITPGNYPITNLFETCIARGEAIGGFVIEENWADIGLPDELHSARGNF